MGLFGRKTKRTYSLKEYAAQKGRDFAAKDEYGLIKYFGDFKLFRVGHSKRITHIQRITKDDFSESGVFDYVYVISSGNSHVPFRQTVYYQLDRRLALPQFHMFPEKWYHRISKWFGQQDINFMEYPTFSGNYLLQGQDEEQVRKLFDEERLIGHFNKHPKWSVEAVGYYFVMYQLKNYQSVDELPEFERVASVLYSILRDQSKILPTLPADPDKNS